MTYERYKVLNILIKKYCRTGDVHDTEWLLRSNLAHCKRTANIIAKVKGHSRRADAIIFYHYGNSVFYTNKRLEKARFQEYEFEEFRTFIHKKEYGSV